MIYAVGDIHGEVGLLDRLIEAIRLDARGTGHQHNKLVFVGDYIDRGAHSADVLERVSTGFDGFETICLLGNHDKSMVEVCRHYDRAVGKAWLSSAIGGREALESYGIDPKAVRKALKSPKKLQKLFAPIPAAHLDFIEGLERMHLADGYLFVHAGVRPGIALEAQRDKDLLWIRRDFTASKHDHGFIVVHGHTWKKKPQVKKNRIGIDTGAYASGCLTCVALDGAKKPRFIQVRK